MRPYRVFAALVLAFALAGFARTAGAAVLITVDKSTQQMTVDVDGELRWVWPVSTGRSNYDTPNGSFTAFRMEKDHFSREWDDAPMPHSIFFTRIGHAIHGTVLTKRLGQPASHGCVRLAPDNAAQLFALVRQQGMLNTTVVIDGELPPEPPVVADSKPAEAPVVAESEQEVMATSSLPRPRPNMSVDEVGRAAPTPRERPQRAARAYAAPPSVYRRPPGSQRPGVNEYRPAQPGPRVHEYRSARPTRTPGVYFDPRVEVIEETLVNGTWVRRRYYRQARPQDFYGYR